MSSNQRLSSISNDDRDRSDCEERKDDESFPKQTTIPIHERANTSPLLGMAGGRTCVASYPRSATPRLVPTPSTIVLPDSSRSTHPSPWTPRTSSRLHKPRDMEWAVVRAWFLGRHRRALSADTSSLCTCSMSPTPTLTCRSSETTSRHQLKGITQYTRPATTSFSHTRGDSYAQHRIRAIFADRLAKSATYTGRAHTCHHGLRLRRRKMDANSQEDEEKPPVVNKFRMVGRVAVQLRRLMKIIIANSMGKTTRSAAEIQWRTLYGHPESDFLAFNKIAFSRDRVISHVPEWAKVMLQVPPESRTEHDCRRLHALLRGLRTFDKFTEEIQMSLCRAFTFLAVSEDRVVLRRGHIGQNFYFIYSGSLFVNVLETDANGDQFVKTEAILGRGDCFGELALLQDIRRTATISVRESCELLVVDKDVFAQVCPRIFDKELADKQHFLSQLPLFGSRWWSHESLRNLCLSAQIQEYKSNKVIVADSKEEEWLYICMEGKCQMIRCLTVNNSNETKLASRKKSSVVLSEEIVQLLAESASAYDTNNQETSGDGGDIKGSLLSSLGLEYVNTGKRRGTFIEEMEQNERKRAEQAAHGPTTLTSLMARRYENGERGVVYLHVGHIESGGVFDLPSLVRGPRSSITGTQLLVSGGARMLRLRKADYLKLATPQALEHARSLMRNESQQSDSSLLESYRQKVSWEKFKAGVVTSIIHSRDDKREPTYRSSQYARGRHALCQHVPLPRKPKQAKISTQNHSSVDDKQTKPGATATNFNDSVKFSHLHHADDFPTIAELEESHFSELDAHIPDASMVRRRLSVKTSSFTLSDSAFLTRRMSRDITAHQRETAIPEEAGE